MHHDELPRCVIHMLCPVPREPSLFIFLFSRILSFYFFFCERELGVLYYLFTFIFANGGNEKKRTPNTFTSRVACAPSLLACQQLSYVKCEPIRFYWKFVRPVESARGAQFTLVHGPGQVLGTTRGRGEMWVISDERLYEGLFEFTW